MKLSDIVGYADLSSYAVVALVIFFAVFVVVAVRLLFLRNSSLQRAARLPLDDDAPETAHDAAVVHGAREENDGR